MDLDLDLDIPERVPEILRRAAESYYEAEEDFKTWTKIARILERAATQIEKIL